MQTQVWKRIVSVAVGVTRIDLDLGVSAFQAFMSYNAKVASQAKKIKQPTLGPFLCLWYKSNNTILWVQINIMSLYQYQESKPVS